MKKFYLSMVLFLALWGGQDYLLAQESRKNNIKNISEITPDAGVSIFWYKDADNDGFGDADLNTPIVFDHDKPPGHVKNNDDCDDNNASIYPGAIDIPNDGIDQDCDGVDKVSTDIGAKIEEFISVYPNPTKDFLYLNGLELNDKARVKVYDFTGKLIIQTSVKKGEEINFSSFNKGIYLLQIKVGDQVIKTRVVKN